MNKFIILTGLPGSGKSTYCKSHPDYVHISSDALRKEMGFEAGEGTAVVFNEMMVRTKEALDKGQTVIWDATNLTRKRRMGTLSQLNKYNVPKHCICFTEPIDVCIRRNNGRTGFDKVPESVIYNMAKSFEVPNEYEGFNEVRFIQTVKGINPAEYLKMAEDFDQDNPHHDMTLYEHLNATYMCATELVEDSSLSADMKDNVRIAALYHDIGKLYTKDYHDSRGNESDIAHYYRHENIGAYMFLSADVKLKDPAPAASLINWHMRPYLKDMSEKKRKAERQMLGKEFCEALDILHEADMISHRFHNKGMDVFERDDQDEPER